MQNAAVLQAVVVSLATALLAVIVRNGGGCAELANLLPQACQLVRKLLVDAVDVRCFGLLLLGNS